MASQFSLLFVSNALLYYTHLLLHAMGGQPRVGTYDCETASKREPLDRGYVDAILQGRRKWSSRKKKASLELPDPFCVAWPADLTGLSSQLDYRVNTARVTDRWARQEESPRSPWQGLHAVYCSLVVEIAACALCAHGDNRDLCMRRIRLCWPT